MTRPQTVQDVFDALGRDRLVEPGRLRAFAERHNPADVSGALERLVAEGLLTPFQAHEVAGGRGAALWVGAYRVLDRLGRGGMGSVFLAEHAVLGRRVAVKALSDSLRADPGSRRRFVREARAAASLDHPNIVRVFDVDMAHDPPYLVMEFVDGVSLQAAVSRSGTFSAGEAASVGVQVADGLAQAAAVGLVHRDIKPANLLIDRRGAVKVLDLGIVRFTQEDTHSRLHAPDVILGTLDYLAPEQAEDSSKVDARADLYALGATLYFLIAGHPPYPVADVRRKLAAKQNEDPPALHLLRPDVAPEFAAVVGRLMARDPAARYPTAAAVVAALHPWIAPGADFPARLFRPASDTTAQGYRRGGSDPGSDHLPDTLCILKPALRRGAADKPHAAPADGAPGPVDLAAGPPGPVTEIVDTDPTDDTQGGAAGSLTDEIFVCPPGPAELPADLTAELNPSPAPVPAAEPPTAAYPVLPVRPARAGVALRVALGLAAAALAAGVAALVALRR